MKIFRKLLSIAYCSVTLLSFAALNIYSTSFKTDNLKQIIERFYNVLWKYMPYLMLILFLAAIVLLILDRKEYFKDKSDYFGYILKYALLIAGLVFSFLPLADWDWQLIFCLAGLAIVTDFRDTAKTTFVYYLFVIVMTLVLWCCGLTNNPDIIEMRHGFMRNPVGFVYPNTFSMMYASAFIVLWMIDNKKNAIAYTIAAAVLSGAILVITDSRTAVIVLVLFVSMLWGRELWKKTYGRLLSLKKISSILYILLPVLCVAATFIIGKICRDVPGMDQSSFSARFYELIDVLRTHGASLFGRDITMPNRIFYDNTYVKIFFRNGIVILASVIALFTLANRKAVKNRDWVAALVLPAIEIYALMEQMYFRPIFILLLIYVFAKGCNTRPKDIQIEDLGKVKVS